MVERSRRAKGKKRLLGNHQRCWIWGRHVVQETLRAGVWPMWELRLSEELPDEELSQVCSTAEKLKIPCSVEPAEKLVQACRTQEHQGYAAKMPPFPYHRADDVLRRASTTPLYGLLDRIQDPYNFGAIIRSAEVLGVDALFVGKTHQAEVSSLVARSSAGAVNHVPIAQLDDLVEWTATLKERSLEIWAAAERGNMAISDCDFRRPGCLIIGNEGEGIRPELLELADCRVRIPQQGKVGSLNAAVSAGICFYEAARQRGGAA